MHHRSAALQIEQRRSVADTDAAGEQWQTIAAWRNTRWSPNGKHGEIGVVDVAPAEFALGAENEPVDVVIVPQLQAAQSALGVRGGVNLAVVDGKIVHEGLAARAKADVRAEIRFRSTDRRRKPGAPLLPESARSRPQCRRPKRARLPPPAPANRCPPRLNRGSRGVSSGGTLLQPSPGYRRRSWKHHRLPDFARPRLPPHPPRRRVRRYLFAHFKTKVRSGDIRSPVEPQPVTR